MDFDFLTDEEFDSYDALRDTANQIEDIASELGLIELSADEPHSSRCRKAMDLLNKAIDVLHG